MSKISVDVFNAKYPTKSSTTIDEISTNDTVLTVKQRLSEKKHIGVERIALRSDPRGKNLRDDQRVADLSLPSANAQLFYRDLGPQIAWKTVFLFEYAGPYFIYPIFYFRPWLIYGDDANKPVASVVTIALICHTIHYAKRLYETQFVHRFSNGTMPQRNLFKNCTYYWGFSAFIAYFVNHPLYTPPSSSLQVYAGLVGFLLSEIGNFSIHILLRDLRPPGTKERKIPFPNSNPFTKLYDFVSCPNYTYEVSAWICFSVMSQCLPAALFTLAGFVQMKIWADGKHRAYRKEFSDYPKGRTPIVPFLC